MHKSMEIVINPKASTGVGSIAMLLSNLKRADSKALAWPTPNVAKRPTYSGTRKEYRVPVIPLADLTAIPKIRLSKETGKSNKIEADKSKFYDLLKHRKYNESKDSLSTKKYRASVPSISGSFARKGNRSSYSFRHRMSQERFRSTLSRHHYEVPQRPTAHKTTGPATSLTDYIYNMLKGISVRKAPEPKQKKSKPEPSTSAGILDIYDSRTGKHRSKRTHRKRRVMRTTYSDLIPNEEKIVKKKKHKKKRRRSKTMEPKQIDTEQDGLQDHKIISNKSPYHESSSMVSRRFKRHASVDSIKKTKKSQFISDYNLLNRDILNSLTDPDKIREFLQNIKRLATKECSLFHQRFVEKTKPPDLKDPQAVEDYLENLDAMVKLARLANERRCKHVGDPDEDSISLDLQIMEKMKSQGDKIKIQPGSAFKPFGKRQTVIQFDNESQNLSYASLNTKVVRPRCTPRKLKISKRKGTQNMNPSGMDVDRPSVKPTRSNSKPQQAVSSSRRRNKYAQPIIVKSRVKIDLPAFPAFESKVDVKLPFVSPISYDEMAKLSPSEFNKIFTTVDRKKKFNSFVKSKKALESNLSLSYQFRLNQVRKFLYGSQVSLADLENVSIDDIDFKNFLNYPYPEKYIERSSSHSLRASHKKSKPDKQSHASVHKLPVVVKTEGSGSKAESDTPPAKPKCCICHSIQRTKPKRDDPLIVKMKNEMKRQALKAYIKEKKLCSGFDQIFNNDRFKFDNRPVLVPCEKPRSVCNQIYNANVFYKNA